MPKMYYTGTLDVDSIIESELDGRFDDLADAVNVKKFDVGQMRYASVRYRHLREPLALFLWKEAIGTAIFSGTLDKGGTNINWTGAILQHQFSIESANNGFDDARPLGHLHASYRSHDWEAGAYEIVLGYSTDGVTYTAYPNTHRFLGYTQALPSGVGISSPLWSNKTTHPMTGALANWWSYTMYGKREASVCIGLMTKNGIDIRTITHWRVGIRVNSSLSNGNGTKDVHSLDVCRIWMSGRDST